MGERGGIARWRSNLGPADRDVQRVLATILLLNWGVAAAKLAYGYWSGALSLVADGYHSLMDGSSNVVGLVGIYAAALPPDEKHPYGHRKFEALTTLVIGALLLATAFEVVREISVRVDSPATVTVTPWSFAIMVATLGVNLWVARYERRRADELHSAILLADSEHTRSDVYVSLSVIGSLVAVRLGYPVLDLIVSAVIAVVVVRIAVGVVRHGIDALTDSRRIPAEALRRIVLSFPRVEHCHGVRTRGTPGHVSVDLNIHVPPEMTVEEGHDLAHDIEDRIRAVYAEVVDVLIHIEPHGHTR